MLSFDVVSGVKHPVIVGALKEYLPAALHLNGAHGVVRATEGKVLAVGRPARAVHSVKGGRVRQLERLLRHVPNLHLTHARGLAAGYSELFAVRRKAHALDAFRYADQPRHQARAVCLVQQHLVKARHREQLAIGRIIHGGDHRGQGVSGGIVHVIFRLGVGGRVVDSSCSDPALHQLNLRLGQGRLVLGHLRLALGVGCDEREQMALGGVLGHYGCLLGIAPGQ